MAAFLVGWLTPSWLSSARSSLPWLRCWPTRCLALSSFLFDSNCCYAIFDLKYSNRTRAS